MQKKTVLITGATSGIGKAAAFQLAKAGASLILLGRNKMKGEKVCNQIISKTRNDKIKFYKADFILLKEVKAAAENISNDYEQIDILINNAGGKFLKHRTSVEGIEQTLAVNHLSHFLLTNILLAKLKSSPCGRIINVSSGVHYSSKVMIENIMSAELYDGGQQYSDSKLANVLFTYQLADLLRGSNVSINAMEPGMVATNFSRNNGLINQAKHLAYGLIKRNLLTPRQGADTIVYLATSPEVEGISSKYFYKKKEKRSSEFSYNIELQKQLWVFSNRLLLNIK